ncbi:P-loop containing nucleoside triphosphate hydrolase protein [Amylostereum chailletii]|nr:P-loop containing nucleoside triphosphate hydrolase protein [Amylostereum chailletii]
MAEQYMHLSQPVFKRPLPDIDVLNIHENELTAAALAKFLETAQNDVVGVAPAFGSQCRLAALAFATPTQVLHVRFSPGSHSATKKSKSKGRKALRDSIFSQATITKATFRADRLVSSLHLDLNLCGTRILDVFSLGTKKDFYPVAFLNSTLGEQNLYQKSVRSIFQDENYTGGDMKNRDTSITHTALRAWVTCQAVLQVDRVLLARAPIVNAFLYGKEVLEELSKLVRDADRLYAVKPSMTKNDVKAEYKHKKGNILVQAERFKTRPRRSTGQYIVVQIETKNGGSSRHEGHAARVKGRSADIQLKGPSPMHGSSIHSVTTIGKEAYTNSESSRERIVWGAFYTPSILDKNPFFKAIWLSLLGPWNSTASIPSPSPVIHCFPPNPLNGSQERAALNGSQERAVRRILSNADMHRLSVIHGPPGTGKTTVIAASVCTIVYQGSGRSVWLVANSNVAVKNIAEKLFGVDFLDFRLLVSEEFQFEWHEHLYEKIEGNVIRSDEFPKTLIGAERLLKGARVILCTVSMLSNSAIWPFTRAVPVETVIVDEASQIQIGDYIPLIHNFKQTLAKLVFIGDDKQLPPFKQDEIPTLRSVFEIPSLREDAIFLDTQYRMPVIIGNFISQHVYNGFLETKHDITSWEACRFVDVIKSAECQSQGGSWTNSHEADAAIRIARKYHEKGKSYRIISPYDAQRGMLEQKLKASGLPWEDRCFNVDSFQGNEEDHIILCLVRSGDKLGFARDERRSNVMLSRCKKSLVICTSKSFVQGEGRDKSAALTVKLAKACGKRAWISWPEHLTGDCYR